MASNTEVSLEKRPYPARTGRLPRDLEEVTPQWLTGLLAHRYPGIEVRSFETVQLINSHTTKLRLALDLNDVGKAAGIPRNVCLKSNWSEGFESGEICGLEARFYYMMRGQVSAPLADAYYADWDDDGGGRGVVVMEDLGSSDGEFGNSSHHLGVDGVARGLESLADMHGSLWNDPVLKAQEWLHYCMDTPVDTDQILRMWNYIKINMARETYKEVLPDFLYKTPELFAHGFDELAIFERERTAREPLCLVHGDSHQGNSFLRANGERVWLDWQLVRKGRPWRDVTYFMMGALTVEERRASAKDLLKVYREKLISTGAEGVLDQDEAWEQIRRWPVYGMQAWLANVDQWGQTGGHEMVNRFSRAAEDFGTFELLTKGRTPPREYRLGEGAREISSGLQHLLKELGL